MSQQDWKYDDLCTAIPILTRNSSSPTDATDLNPIIRQLLDKCPDSSILAVGSHCVILAINQNTVAKVALKPGDWHVSHEQSIFELLDRTPSPYIVQSFLRCPGVTFMERVQGGTLHSRMGILKGSCPVLQWMRQLTEAVACLESHGWAHGDINPRNILCDNDQIKLIDFDHALKFGADLDVGYEPYVRSRKRGENGGDYGVAGPETEQFALGSVFWFMTRGTELYEELEGPEQVDRLMNRQFPATDPENPVDKIINDCWLGKFVSIAELSMRVREAAAFDETFKARRRQCEQYYQQLQLRE